MSFNLRQQAVINSSILQTKFYIKNSWIYKQDCDQDKNLWLYVRGEKIYPCDKKSCIDT